MTERRYADSETVEKAETGGNTGCCSTANENPDVPVREKSGDGRIRIGAAVISFLGILFGSSLMIACAFLNWRSDNILGLYAQSGLDFANLINGDGKISLALGCIVFASLSLGGILCWRVFYGAALVCSVAAMILSVYEIIYVSLSPGVVSPGAGMFMLLGGGVVGVFSSLGGFFMASERKAVPCSRVTDAET